MTLNITATPMPRFLRPRLYTITIVVAALALAGIMLIARTGQLDRDRDLKIWQEKLNLIADSRASAVGEWVDFHFREMKKLSANPSLQLYLTELSSENGANLAQEPAQKTYLRNLLIFTADHLGFAPKTVPMSLQIPTQIPYEALSGIAVVDNQNKIVVSTPYLKALNETISSQITRLPESSPTLIDLYKETDGQPQMGFIVPVYGIQADPGASAPLARIVGIKQVDDSLFKLLAHPGTTEKTMEAFLVRKDGDNLTYLSPVADGSAPMQKTLTADPAKLAEAEAVESPSSFIGGRDYSSRNALLTSRRIEGTPWTLIVKVDRAEALAENAVRHQGMLIMLGLAIAVVITTVIAVWYIATSKQATLASGFFRDVAERATAQERLLKLVTDNQPEAIFILDGENKYRFANHNAAHEAGMQAGDMAGKSITDVLGTARAQDIIDMAEAALYNQHPRTRIQRLNEDGDEKILKFDYVPLASIPVPGMPENTPGVLVVEQNISEVVHERERRIRLNRQIVETLIAIVDKRDPHSANHSRIVSELAYEVALAMGLDNLTCETARIAGSLMNLGKIVVPPQVLTKRDALSEDEIRNIRESLTHSADLLSDISFDGPVVETLRQAQEHWDGTGPQGLKEEGILVTARIIAVVNAFVGMVSPRSYRAAMPVEGAIQLLTEKDDVIYDRKVVFALANFMENQGGRGVLEQLRTENRGPAAASA